MKYWLLFFFLGITQLGMAQPRQMDYFHKDHGSNWRTLDPGDYILANSVLIGNYHPRARVSFTLSWTDRFEKESSSIFSLEASFASTFQLNNREGCWIRIVTAFSKSQTTEVVYFLEKGNCYAIYWNVKKRRWDMAQARCRMEGS
jgi:hypothetical protein